MRVLDSMLSATRNWPARVLIALGVVALAAGCATVALHPWRTSSASHNAATRPSGGNGSPGDPGRDPSDGAGASAPGSESPSNPPSSAPAGPFAVGQRQLPLNRGGARPLQTTIWYPADGAAGGNPHSQVPAAKGRYPLVLFSHGLPSLPETYAPIAIRLAAAGFVVAAPAYPHTNSTATMPTMADVPNQPADAYYVIDEVLRLDTRSGDLLAGHLNGAKFAAVGHSAGGFTTAGMLNQAHDERLAAAVIIAGGMLGPWGAPEAEMLFIHGDADQTISYSAGREAYQWVPWSKSLLTVIGGDHKRYLSPGEPGFDPVMATMTDFLRATLYGDATARRRMADDGAAEGVRYEHVD